MTEITLKLTFEELKALDKYVELNDETRPLFDKIRNAYPKPETLFDVIRNLGYSYDCCYEIVDAVEEFQKPKEPEKWDIKVETDYLTGKARHKWNIVDKDGNDYKPTPQEPEDDEWTIEKLQEKNWYVDAKTLLKSKEPEKEQQIKELVRESVKWCEEHPNESVEDYLKPHTPEKTEKSLRTAFGKAQQTEKWKETQRKIDAPKESWMNKSDEELVAILKKNPPKCLEFQLGKSLEDRIYKWWETCFVHHPEWSMEECVEDLLDIITLFLPAEQSHEGTQNIDTVVAVEAHNELLQKIKSKLRNKKDT